MKNSMHVLVVNIPYKAEHYFEQFFGIRHSTDMICPYSKCGRIHV